MIGQHRIAMLASGEHQQRRKRQELDWMHFLLVENLKTWFYSNPDVVRQLPIVRKELEENNMSASTAAAILLRTLHKTT